MQKIAVISLGLVLAFFSTASLQAKDAGPSLADVEEKIRANLRKSRPDIPVLGVSDSVMEGFYEVSLGGGQVLYFSADGKKFFTGDIYQLADSGLENLSEQKRAVQRKVVMDRLDEKDMVVFSPPADRVKATVTVFTDIDCVYCRKLHQEVPDLNRMGVAIRYLAFPRAGTRSDSYDKLVSAWCAKNPQDALTKAKNGVAIPDATCDNPVASQYSLGSTLGVNSTPSLLFEDGTIAPGYLPAEQLAKQLGIL